MTVVHVWFSTKYRRGVLVDEINAMVRSSVETVAKSIDVAILAFAMEIDHVHLVLAIPDDRTIPSTMHRLKGASAREVLRAFPELKTDLGAQSFWQKGYGVRRLMESELPTVIEYVRTQNERPARHS
jgi:putative transposase